MNAQAESRLIVIRVARLLTNRKQRDSSAMKTRQVLGEVTASLAAPVIINMSESATVAPSEMAIAEGHVARAVQNLMDLEALIEK